MAYVMKLDTGVELRWIPIANSTDYRAGSDGRIYSRVGHRGAKVTKHVDWYALDPKPGVNGYRRVALCTGKITKGYGVHRLICMAFHGRPMRKRRVIHLNSNRGDNTPENLWWEGKVRPRPKKKHSVW